MREKETAMRVGYARVSTKEQSVAMQVDAQRSDVKPTLYAYLSIEGCS